MADAQDFVNKVLSSDDNPSSYVDWLGKKTDVGEAGQVRFGIHIHTTDEEVIEINAKEAGVKTDSKFWETIGSDIRYLEENAAVIARESGLYIQGEGHGDTGEYIGSAWVSATANPTTAKGIPLHQTQIAIAKKLVELGSDMPSTSDGSFWTFFPGSDSKLYRDVSEWGQQFIDVAVEFTGTDALAEWLKLNVIESIDTDDPESFIKTFVPRLKGKLVIDYCFHVTQCKDSVYENVDGLELVRHEPKAAMDRMVKDLRSREALGAGDKAYRIRVEPPWRSAITQTWLEQIGISPEDLAKVNDPNSSALMYFYTTKQEFYNYIRYVYPQIRLRESEDVDSPEGYLDKVTGWIDTFLNAGMMRDNSAAHPNQFWKRYECAGSNYAVYLHVRSPLWLLVLRTDAATGKGQFNIPFTFVDGDTEGMVAQFTALDRLLTQCRTRAHSDWPTVDAEIVDMEKQNERDRKRKLGGTRSVKEAVDDPILQQLLDKASPQPCFSCYADLTVPFSVIRHYIGDNSELTLEGHYSREDGTFTNDEPYSTSFLDKLVDHNLAADPDTCKKCGTNTTKPGSMRNESVEAGIDDPESVVKSYQKKYFKLFYGRKFGEGAFVGVYDSIESALQSAKERKLRARARNVWIVEETTGSGDSYRQWPSGEIVVVGSAPTGIIYDVVKGYKTAPRAVSENIDEPDLNPQQYVNQIHDLADLTHEIQNYGMFVNRIHPWGRWVVLSGGAYWATLHGRDDDEEPLKADFFQAKLDEFMKKLGITQYHVKVGQTGTNNEHVWYQLGIPKSQLEQESWQPFIRNTSWPEASTDIAKWLPESTDPDDPSANVERYAQHVEKTEQERLDGFITNALSHFDTLIDKRGITDSRRADELAAEVGSHWAECGGYDNGSDEFDHIVSAVNNRASELFPGQWEDYPESDHPVQENAENITNWTEFLDIVVETGHLSRKDAIRYQQRHVPEIDEQIYSLFIEMDEASQNGDSTEVTAKLQHIARLVKVQNMRYGSAIKDVMRDLPVDENIDPDSPEANLERYIPDMDDVAVFKKLGFKHYPGSTPRQFPERWVLIRRHLMARLTYTDKPFVYNLWIGTRNRQGDYAQKSDTDVHLSDLTNQLKLAKLIVESDYGNPERYIKQVPIKVKAEIIGGYFAGQQIAGPRLDFDAGPYFDHLARTNDLNQMLELARAEFQTSYAADAVAQFFCDTTIKDFWCNLRHGYDVFVDEDDVKRWVEHVKPEWFPYLWPNEVQIKEGIDDEPQGYLDDLVQNDLSTLYREHGLHVNEQGDYAFGAVPLRNPAAILYHGQLRDFDGLYLTVHTHPYQQWMTVSISVRPADHGIWQHGIGKKQVKGRWWTIPANKRREVVGKLLAKIEAVCQNNPPTWAEIEPQIKAALKLFRGYKSMAIPQPKSVAESVDDPNPQFMQDTFDVPTILKRRGYERHGHQYAWTKVFRNAGGIDYHIVVTQRGFGGGDAGNAIYDTTLFHFLPGEKEGSPIAQRYARNNKNLEPMLIALEARVKANHLHGVATDTEIAGNPEFDDFVAENLDDPDDPSTTIAAHTQDLVADPDEPVKLNQHPHGEAEAELEVLGFKPSWIAGKNTIYGEPEIPNFWSKAYRGPGSSKVLFLKIIPGKTGAAVSVRTRTMSSPVSLKPRSMAHIVTIIKDVDAAVQRAAANNLSKEQEIDAIVSVLDHHRQWCHTS